MFNFKKKYTILLRKNFVVNSNKKDPFTKRSNILYYRFNMILNKIDKEPIIGDTITIIGKDGKERNLGKVENRNNILKNENINVNDEYGKIDFKINLEPKIHTIYGLNFNDIEIDDVYSIWLDLQYEFFCGFKTKFEEEDQKELWDSWEEEFVKNKLNVSKEFMKPLDLGIWTNE